MPMKILVSDQIPKTSVDLLRAASGVEVVEKVGLTEEQLLPLVADIDAWVVRSATKVTRRLIDAAPRLRWVGRAGAGLDTIDVAAAKERGIEVMNVPGANSIAVAELVFGLLLSLFRRLPEADASLRRGEWLKSKLMGRELRGKTLGIVGVGKIGREVAKRAAAFEMKCVGYDPLVAADAMRAAGVEPATLERLLAQSDVVSLHLPVTPETKKMFDAARIASMKKGAVLVNAARGDLMDEPALLEALQSGQLAGAALDVFAVEPAGANPLFALPNVVASPHIGASTREAQEACGDEIARMLLERMAAVTRT
ncbi:MAG TPA: hydroxyacid dehydrogenase [Candidatus Eisenbacteria bacterium]|nr:hydroxyacid dehydrogenase [Candidatus Eisenbacteria bacterium]